MTVSGLAATPVANRVRISLFGRRNAGKSSLVNALTGQEVAIVSDVPGTTTDPVSKTMEILPLGPCLVTDTAGLDDTGRLGEERVRRSFQVLDLTDIAIVAIPADADPSAPEVELVAKLKGKKLPYLVVRTKSDLPRRAGEEGTGDSADFNGPNVLYTSLDDPKSIVALRERLASLAPADPPAPLVADLVSPGDIAVCVCPIDASAPKGRLILPQQQVIRELIENGAAALVCQPGELAGLIARIGNRNIRFVITDSQAFAEVDAVTPKDIPLTSFSIVFARQKGDLAVLCEGAKALKTLSDGDVVLVSEGCTHHRQCGDIGTVKLPAWIRKFTGKKIDFRFSSGGDFPLENEPKPKLVVHCGGCMLTRRAVMSRITRCKEAGIPVVNYGVAIALMHGIVAKSGSCMVNR